MEPKIPTSKMARGRVMGKAMLKIGMTHSTGKIKRAFRSKAQQEASAEETHEAIAKVIMEALGTLKGVSVKIAQQIALGLPFLPQSYLDEMGKSFHAIPPINRALIRKIIKQELGAYPEACFDYFEGEAFGAASLGQVHRATKGAKALAVKVQYPGIAKSLESDMSILRFALRRFAKGGNVDHLVAEIEARLYEEVDYLHEAENTDYFRTQMHHEHIVIPRVYPELSTQRVLSTEFLEGESFAGFLASNPTQAERDHYAQLIFDSFFISMYEIGRVHADPNPGNFIFMAEGKLGLIDFGCVKKLDDGFLSSFARLHRSLMDQLPEEEIVEQYAQLRMIDRDTPERMLAFYQEVIKPLDRLYIEVFQSDHYDFGNGCNFAKRGFATILEVQQKSITAVDKMNEEYIFVDRTLLGYYAMFEQMEATIDTRFVQALLRERG